MERMCLLDLDGVIFDFVGASLELHGKSIPRHEVQYDFWKQVGMTGEEFFAPLRQREFWANLPFTEEAAFILGMVKEEFGEKVFLMTQAPDLAYGDGSSNAILGKMDLILKMLPEYSGRYFIGRPKGVLGARGKVLIDDTEENCIEFQKQGGTTVLVPRPWNTNRNLAYNGNFSENEFRSLIRATKG